ncbi:zinc ABC transporter substrate-binding protein [Aquibacillus koreensis]|uniref:Zinc ABC transporter substrate-binding protein n=1 Tax=Aquibacillus koreensis TaxID=279446 RepID=A0A9X3WIL5_9BACI|nr:zinc ABC transporter substrate-binding protein [Aquibacillus koreensis]MCT2535939.1 zinc ABC transporter substrate-binding protein [Aquibacillus koreensis]MDC3420395.1 zinc ABC transporter substrate-binding protein [Aquibacillus koreensis]
MKKSIILCISFFIILLAGCNQASSTNQDTEKPIIYTTIYPIQYIVDQLAGETVETVSIYPPGTDAHSYEPSAKNMTDIAKGDAFIYLGSNLEAFSDTIANALNGENTNLIEVGLHEELFEDLSDSQGHGDDHDESHDHGSHEDDVHDDGHAHGDHDPHIWLDPIRMITLASIVKAELNELLPEQEMKINDNFHALEKELQQLDSNFQDVLADKEQKKILVSHAAYGYWEQRYGLEQIAVKGVAANNEPSQQELVRIMDQAKQYNLNYMIFEQNISEKVAKNIQNEIGASSLFIHNLAVLTDEDIKNSEDYFSLMEKNIEVIDQATK